MCFVFLCMYNKGLLNVAKLSGKRLCWSLFLNKVASLHLANLSKKKHRQYCVRFKSIFFREHLWVTTSAFPFVLSVFNHSVANKESCIHTFYRLFARIFLSLICFRFRQIYLVFQSVLSSSVIWLNKTVMKILKWM